MLFHFCYKEVYLAMDDVKIRILLWKTKSLLTTQGGVTLTISASSMCSLVDYQRWEDEYRIINKNIGLSYIKDDKLAVIKLRAVERDWASVYQNFHNASFHRENPRICYNSFYYGHLYMPEQRITRWAISKIFRIGHKCRKSCDRVWLYSKNLLQERTIVNFFFFASWWWQLKDERNRPLCP